ncbi:transposase [Desulfovibrio sp. UCD-KL4C]|uniref:transposase n=1 Tax=Desulfovibrio sp. UCD-KL4C TaxID=2578120 RepID=UPI0025BE791A|nr:transposase [Desulfovibrio sp. UCD-KL4C]
MSNQKYSEEFRKSAVKLVTDLGYSFNEAADQLGCSSWSIRQWSKKYAKLKGLPPQFENISAADEMKKVREENARLRMENEILKKAAAYFAKESL